MSGVFWLDWAAGLVSLFNAILLLWLGLSVLLNADRRTWGLWSASGALLLGGLFFIIHTLILGYGPALFTHQLDFWWRLGWVPVVALPLAWYALMLWYSGLWDPPQNGLQGRARLWLPAALLLACLITWMLFYANPLPSLSQVYDMEMDSSRQLGGIPALALVYPFYILLTTSLSLDALLRPGRPRRLLGDAARRRARPWLVTATLLLILVSLLVGGLMIWITWLPPAAFLASPRIQTITLFDLAVAGLITGAILVVGQAVVSYEVFTGRTLPRQGLRRAWRTAILLAVGYAAAISLTLHLPLPPVYGLVLASVLMTVFFALWSWRVLQERGLPLQILQPFLAGPHLYPEFLSPETLIPDDSRLQASFFALCSQILDASLAYLAPLGPFSALAGSRSLVFPAGAPPLPLPIDYPIEPLAASGALILPLEPGRYGPARWAVPLYSASDHSRYPGAVGLLLLGEPRSAGLYSQEAVELARAAAERILDGLAAAELARRLAALQRQRLVDTRLLDHQARRVLHDEVLPSLHAALLGLNAGQSQEALESLASAHRQISDLLRQAPPAAPLVLERAGLLEALRQALQAEFSGVFTAVDWLTDDEVETRTRQLPQAEAEVIYYAAREAVRNAARHGSRLRPAGLRLLLQASWQAGLSLAIEDNGGGAAALAGGDQPNGELPQGSRQGLALHSALMAVIGGSLSLEGRPGETTRVVLRLPRPA